MGAEDPDARSRRPGGCTGSAIPPQQGFSGAQDPKYVKKASEYVTGRIVWERVGGVGFKEASTRERKDASHA